MGEMHEGKEYTRVSEILNPFSGYGEVPELILQKAQRRGERIHKFIEKDIKGIELQEIDPLHKGYIDSYRSYQIPGEVVLMEKRIYDKEHMITGKNDLLVKDDGKFKLVDWKTSSKENKTWALQGSAYAWLAKQLGYHVEEIIFVKLDKKGRSPQVFHYEYNVEEFFKCFDMYQKYFKDMPYYIFEE